MPWDPSHGSGASSRTWCPLLHRCSRTSPNRHHQCSAVVLRVEAHGIGPYETSLTSGGGTATLEAVRVGGPLPALSSRSRTHDPTAERDGDVPPHGCGGQHRA